MADAIFVPPHSTEAEEAVLGSLLIDADAIHKVAGLQPEQFYVVKNQWVYQAMLQLHSRHEPIDFLTVCQELEKHGKLDETGGEGWIASLTSAVPTALNVEAYAREVADAALRRKTINTAEDIARLAWDETQPVDEMLAKAEASIFSIGKNRNNGKFVSLRSVLDRLWGKIEDAFANPDKPRGVPYGYSVMDDKFGNMEYGALITIGARPGVGKSALMLSMALKQAKQGVGVLFYPYEMLDEQLTLRVLAQETGFGYKEIQYAQRVEQDGSWRPMNSEELDVIARASIRLADLPLYFRDDQPPVEMFKSSIMRAIAEYGLEQDKVAVFSDYLQIMKAVKRIDNRDREIGYMTGVLKQVALELRIPIVIAAQLNREVEKRADNRPTLADLRESGNIEQDSDVVMFIYRDELYNPDTEFKNIAEIIVRKNRNGGDGKAMLFWDKRAIAFKDLAKERIEL